MPNTQTNMQPASMYHMEEKPFDTMEYTFVAGAILPEGRHKSIMRRIGKHSGGVTHVTLTIPTYLIDTIDSFTSSRSAYITLAVEKHMRYAGLLNNKWPSLSRLYYHLVHMDLWVQQLQARGRAGWSIDKDKVVKSYRAYFKRFERYMEERVNDLAGLRTSFGGMRKEIREPYIRTRPDMVRRTDSESESDLGAEAYVDKTDEKNEIYRTDRDKFRQLWPAEYAERRRQDEQRLEDERQDPPDWKEDGDDPPEK